MATDIKKVVLAYSGGLDTSIILKWIKEEYGAEVVTYTADVGQGEEVEEARVKALETGATEAICEDLTEEFVTEYVFPALRASSLYEGYYHMGTLQSKPAPTPLHTVPQARETTRCVSNSRRTLSSQTSR